MTGRVTRRNALKRLAPWMRAASSRRLSKRCRTATTDPMTNGRRDEDVPDGQTVQGALPVDDRSCLRPRRKAAGMQSPTLSAGICRGERKMAEMKVLSLRSLRTMPSAAGIPMAQAPSAATDASARLIPNAYSWSLGISRYHWMEGSSGGKANGGVELASLKGCSHHDDHRRQEKDIGQAAPEDRQTPSPESGRQRAARVRPRCDRHAAASARRRPGTSVPRAHATTSRAVRSRRSR